MIEVNWFTEWEKANFKPNQEIAVVTCLKGVMCAVSWMAKAERLLGAASKTLIPLIKGAIGQEGRSHERRKNQKSR